MTAASPSRRILEGRVESGFGLAQDSLTPVLALICEKSGLELVPGTLNVKLPAPYIVIPDLVLEARDTEHHETLLLQRCRVEGFSGLIVRSSTQARGESHPLDVVEIATVAHLRFTLGLVDGDAVKLEVDRVI